MAISVHVQYSTVQYSSDIYFSAVPCRVPECHVKPGPCLVNRTHSVLMEYTTVKYSAVNFAIYSAVQCSIVQFSIVQCSVVHCQQSVGGREQPG